MDTFWIGNFKGAGKIWRLSRLGLLVEGLSPTLSL